MTIFSSNLLRIYLNCHETEHVFFHTYSLYTNLECFLSIPPGVQHHNDYTPIRVLVRYIFKVVTKIVATNFPGTSFDELGEVANREILNILLILEKENGAYKNMNIYGKLQSLGCYSLTERNQQN